MQRGEWGAHCLQMQEAWDFWLERDHLTFEDLVWCLKAVCLGPGDWPRLTYHRVADAMLQRARKKGVIRAQKGMRTWEPLPGCLPGSGPKASKESE